MKSALFTLCACLLSLVLLNGCVYTGYDSDNERCIDFMDPLEFTMLFVAAPECNPSSVFNADDSTKHVKFTEEKRLLMAKEAAEILYPFNAVNKMRLASGAADHIFANTMNNNDAYTSECNAAAVTHDLALKLVSKLPDAEVFYNDIATNWSMQYSDDQLELILKKARSFKEDGHDKVETIKFSLSPQPPLYSGNILNNSLSSLVIFSKSYQAEYASYVKTRYAEIVASKRFQISSWCQEKITNEVTGDYEVVEIKLKH